MSLSSNVIGVVPNEEHPYTYVVWLYSYLSGSRVDPTIISKIDDDLVTKPNPKVFVDMFPNNPEQYSGATFLSIRKQATCAEECKPPVLSAMWAKKSQDPVPLLLQILDVDPDMKPRKFRDRLEEDLFIKHIGMIQRNFTSFRSLQSIIRKPDVRNEATYALATSSGLDALIRNMPRDDSIVNTARVVTRSDTRCIIIQIPYRLLVERVHSVYLNTVSRDHQLNKCNAIIYVCEYNSVTEVAIYRNSGSIDKLLQDSGGPTFTSSLLKDWSDWSGTMSVQDLRAAVGATYDTAEDVFAPEYKCGSAVNEPKLPDRIAAALADALVLSPQTDTSNVEIAPADIQPREDLPVVPQPVVSQPVIVVPEEEKVLVPKKLLVDLAALLLQLKTVLNSNSPV